MATSDTPGRVRNLAPDIQAARARADWPRPCLLIPELAQPPRADDITNDTFWARGAEGEMTFALASNRPAAADTRFRAGHRNGLLYLRIPYLITPGNHTVGRWDDFYGPTSLACDDGPMRIVTFGDMPGDSWREAAALLGARAEATNRVLLCYEAWPPAELPGECKVNLMWDGHSTEWDRRDGRRPGGALHLGLPNDQQEIRWISMTQRGMAPGVKTTGDAPTLPMPRHAPSPLHVEFAATNHGKAGSNTARLINTSHLAFRQARVRFVVKAGAYHVVGGRVLQQFASDDGAVRVIDVEAAVTAQSETVIEVKAASAGA